MLRRLRYRSGHLYVVAAASALILTCMVVRLAEVRPMADRTVGVELAEKPDGLIIAGVVPDGPADRAGLQPGDRLRSIDGRAIATALDYDAAAGGFKRGEPSLFSAQRGQEQRGVTVQPGVRADWLPTFWMALVVLLCLIVGSVCLAGRTTDVRARLLALVFFLIALEFALPQGVSMTSWWRPVGLVAYYVLTGSQFAIELHLASVIPYLRHGSRRHRVFLIACYAVGGTIAVVGALTAALEFAGWSGLPFTLYAVDALILNWVFPAWALGVVGLLARAVLRDRTTRGRLQAGAVLAGVLPWAVYTLVDWANGFPQNLSPFFEGLFPFLVLFYPIAIFVAIFRYRLFDLPLVVRRSLLYTGVTSSLVFVFYAALGAGGAFFSRFVQGERASIWTMSVATLILGLLFSPLRRATSGFIERRFFPERLALRRRLIDLASELPALGRLDRMGEHLVRSLRQIFGTKSATLLLVEPTSKALYRLARSPVLSGEIEKTSFLAEDDPAIERLREAGRPLHGYDILGASALTQRMGRTQVELAVPLFQENRLVGVLLMGRKISRERFTAEEIELLSLVAHQVATVLDNVRLFQSATYEGLTGLLRREAALESLDGEVDRARRYRRPLTIALADIDHFKKINDRFGHLEGDRVLRAVANSLKAVIRASDVVARYGGEEFLLVFPETDIKAAGDLSEKLRGTIETLELQADDGSPIEVRVSIGVAALASLPDDATTSQFIAAADRELYRAKAAGRNRVEPRLKIVAESRFHDPDRQGARSAKG